jgi:hypothetical protein
MLSRLENDILGNEAGLLALGAALTRSRAAFRSRSLTSATRPRVGAGLAG